MPDTSTDSLFSRFVSLLILALLALAALLFGASFAHAQNNAGTVGITTVTVPVFAAQSTTLSTGGIWQCGTLTPVRCPVLPDGYAANFLEYCNTNFTGTIDLEWSPTTVAGPFYPLKTASYGPTYADNACHTLQLGGYWPNLRATVTPTAGSMSATYTASGGPISYVAAGLGSNGDASPIVCDLNAVQIQATGSVGSIASIGPLLAGDTIVICGFTISFDGTTSAGNVSVQWASSTGRCAASSTGTTWEAYTTASTPQTLSVAIAQRPAGGGGLGGAQALPYPCISNNSGANVQISISYASVHGL